MAVGTGVLGGTVGFVLYDALRQLVGGYAVDDYDESAVRGAHESEEEPGLH